MRVDAIGFVEVVGLVAAIEAADAMVKAARVRLLKQHTMSPGWVTVVVEGDLASCKAAVDAGKAAAARLGRVISTLVLGRPDVDTERLVLDHLRPEPEAAPPRRKTSTVGARKPQAASPPAPLPTQMDVPFPVSAAEVVSEAVGSLPAPPRTEEAAPVVDVPAMPVEVLAAPPESLPLPGLDAVLTALIEAPVAVSPKVVEPPATETLLAYVAAATRGRTCQEVARRFHLTTAAAREILEQGVTDARLDKSGSRYLVAQRLI